MILSIECFFTSNCINFHWFRQWGFSIYGSFIFKEVVIIGHLRLFTVSRILKLIKTLSWVSNFLKKDVPESNIDVNIIVQIKMMNVPMDIPIIYCRRGKLRIKQTQRTKVVKLNFSLHFYFRVFSDGMICLETLFLIVFHLVGVFRVVPGRPRFVLTRSQSVLAC